MIRIGLVVVLIAAAAWADRAAEVDEYLATSKSHYEDVPDFGGPNSVGVQLKEDDFFKRPPFRFPVLDRALEPWFAWKGRLNERTGFAFSPDYTVVYLVADQSPGEDQAAGGLARLFGSWTPVGRGTANTGSLVFKVEHRHRFSDIPPSQLGFEAGAASLIAAPWGNQGWLLTNFYWHQKLLEGRFAFLAGFVDATDYLNVYGLASPWLHFLNLEFETGVTIPIPNQGLGFVAAGWLTDNVYLVGGLADSNSDPTDPGQSFETFFRDHEYLVHAELGWVSSRDNRYLDNIHLTWWHADERTKTDTPDGWGLNFSATKFLHGRYMPFLRAGWSDGGGALMEATISTGVGIYLEQHRDLFAIAAGWARPADPALRDQYTIEIFYRWQLGENLALTPDLQFILDPALNPDDDLLFIFGLRLRLAF
ncbi:MAG: carbohydrate porin [Planctomycetota bacterium]|jgi:porin